MIVPSHCYESVTNGREGPVSEMFFQNLIGLTTSIYGCSSFGTSPQVRSSWRIDYGETLSSVRKKWRWSAFSWQANGKISLCKREKFPGRSGLASHDMGKALQVCLRRRLVHHVWFSAFLWLSLFPMGTLPLARQSPGEKGFTPMVPWPGNGMKKGNVYASKQTRNDSSLR